MPAIGFVCPNGDKVKFGECFAGCDHECMALPARKTLGDQRPWWGKPSVTQLLKPTLQTYLEITHDYYIPVMGGIAAQIGTNSHKMCEDHVPNGWLSEVRLEDDICSGAFDAYDCKNHLLWDYKFFNDFKIAKMLGCRSKWQKYTVTRGKDKGKEKWKQVYSLDGVRDIMEQAKQLSYYKILMEKHGLKVDNININVFLRGGLTATAKSYGLTQAAYVIPIFPLPERHIRAYMKCKYDRLMKALETNTPPPTCSKKDRWDTSKSYSDRRCRDWCNVNKFCPYYQKNWM